MKKIPIFGESVKAINPQITAQHRVNCFYEVVLGGEKEGVAIRGTPGLTLFTTFPTYPIRGWCAAGAYLYVVAGTYLYQVSINGGYLNVGTLTNATTPVSMAINENQLMVVDGVAGYVFPYSRVVNSASQTQINTLINDVTSLTTITQALGFQ
jgi:hypothetical protein